MPHLFRLPGGPRIPMFLTIIAFPFGGRQFDFLSLPSDPRLTFLSQNPANSDAPHQLQSFVSISMCVFACLCVQVCVHMLCMCVYPCAFTGLCANVESGQTLESGCSVPQLRLLFRMLRSSCLGASGSFRDLPGLLSASCPTA